MKTKKTYKIEIIPNYYYGTLNARPPYLARICDLRGDGSQEVAEFSNRAAAQKAADNLFKGTYYLAHGEAGLPACRITTRKI